MAKRKREPDPRPIPRCMLFNEQGGKIFVGEEAIKAALNDDWSEEPLPADQLAQSGDPGDDSQQVIQELNAKLVELTDDLTAANKAAKDAGAAQAAAEKRAAAAESKAEKLAAALKKAQVSARK